MSGQRDGIVMTIHGLAEVELYLKRFSAEIRLKAIGRALRVALRPVLKTVRANVPVRYGLLKRSIGIKFKKYRRGSIQYAVIGPRRGFRYAGSFIIGGRRVVADPTMYAHLVEGGTAPHRIGKGSSLGGENRSGKMRKRVEKGGMHPGTKPVPFMRKAFDVHKRTLTATFVKSIGTEAERIAARLARKGKTA